MEFLFPRIYSIFCLTRTTTKKEEINLARVFRQYRSLSLAFISTNLRSRWTFYRNYNKSSFKVYNFNTIDSVTYNITTKMTTTSLNRWSCIQKELPNVENISEVNIFDFDNTCTIDLFLLYLISLNISHI